MLLRALELVDGIIPCVSKVVAAKLDDSVRWPRCKHARLTSVTRANMPQMAVARCRITLCRLPLSSLPVFRLRLVAWARQRVLELGLRAGSRDLLMRADKATQREEGHAVVIDQ